MCILNVSWYCSVTPVDELFLGTWGNIQAPDKQIGRQSVAGWPVENRQRLVNSARQLCCMMCATRGICKRVERGIESVRQHFPPWLLGMLVEESKSFCCGLM